MMQPRRAPLSPELILRLQTTVGNRAVQRLMERREPEAPEPAERLWLRWRFCLVGGAAGLFGAIIGAILWFGFHRHIAGIIALFVAAAVVLCVVGWNRYRLHRTGDE
jgi:hypothetical protein